MARSQRAWVRARLPCLWTLEAPSRRVSFLLACSVPPCGRCAVAVEASQCVAQARGTALAGVGFIGKHPLLLVPYSHTRIHTLAAARPVTIGLEGIDMASLKDRDVLLVEDIVDTGVCGLVAWNPQFVGVDLWASLTNCAFVCGGFATPPPPPHTHTPPLPLSPPPSHTLTHTPLGALLQRPVHVQVDSPAAGAWAQERAGVHPVRKAHGAVLRLQVPLRRVFGS
jgi:hypothetical protein